MAEKKEVTKRRRKDLQSFNEISYKAVIYFFLYFIDQNLVPYLTCWSSLENITLNP
jgi:hypothetical protein